MNENTTRNWYATKAGAQGLIIEEDTGRNVAVAYDAKDASLLAAAPTMLAALKQLDDRWDELPRDLQQVVIKAIEAAEDVLP